MGEKPKEDNVKDKLKEEENKFQDVIKKENQEEKKEEEQEKKDKEEKEKKEKEEKEKKDKEEKEKKEKEEKEKKDKEEKEKKDKEKKEKKKEKKEENNNVQKEVNEVKKVNDCGKEKVNEKEKNENKIEKDDKKEIEENQKNEDKIKKDMEENSNNSKIQSKTLNNMEKNIKIDENRRWISCNCISIIVHLGILLLEILIFFFYQKIYKKIIENSKNKIIIGLDFGSTQSGYQIFYHPKDDFEGDEKSSIITTELIFDLYFKKGLSIGKEAKFYPKENIELERKLYFSQFKRNLDPKHKNNMANSTIPIGGKLEIDIVIKEFLILMKEHIIKNVKKINYTNLKDVKWILTVPPLWDDNAIKMMKELAIKAEMNDVEIALEPEVASLAIFYDTNIDKELLKPQKSFFIVDMGGLTIDFTAMKILDKDFNLEQLLEPFSFAFGSNFINDKIIDIIETVYGKEKLDAVKKTNYKLWEKTLDEIEEKKKIIDDNEAEAFNISINFNDKKCSFWGDNCKFPYNDTEIPYTSSHISIPKHLILNIINDLGDKIINKIKEKINDKIDYILITGGFSNNKILRKKLIKSLSKYYEVLFLSEPEKTVMKGAALYGKKPNQIKSRIMPVSIGISLDDNKFYTFVKRGESVDVTKKKSTDIQLTGDSILFYYNYKSKDIDDKNKYFLDEIKLPYIDSEDKRNMTLYIQFSSYITVEIKENDIETKKILYYPHDNDDKNI